jgi:hypothetical protein
MSRPGFGSQFGMSGMGMNRPIVNGASGFTDIGDILSDDFRPAQVREALSFDHSSEMVLLSLRELPAFGKLPEATKNMYEVETTQLLQSMTERFGAADDIGLVALSQHPGTSKHLSRFLVEALPVAA